MVDAALVTQLAAVMKQALLPELAATLRGEILAGVQKAASLDGHAGSGAGLKHPPAAEEKPTASGFTGLLALAAQGDQDLKHSRHPAAKPRQTKQVTIEEEPNSETSGTDLSPPPSPKRDKSKDKRHRRSGRSSGESDHDSEEDDLERERRAERRMLTHARDFRAKSGSIAAYYASRQAAYTSVRNWKESMFLAQVADELYEEVSGAEKLKAFKSVLRRIAALEVVDRTKEWDVADRVQKAWVSETMLHPEDMRYYVKQHRSLQPETKSHKGKSGGKGAGSGQDSGSAPSKGFYNRRFNYNKGSRSDSKSPARAKSPAGTDLVKASAPAGNGKGGAKTK